MLLLTASRYTSETQLSISVPSVNPYPDEKSAASGVDSVSSRLDKEAINTHARALLAPDLVLATARELDLASRAEFNEAVGSVDTLSAILRTLGLAGPRPGESEDDRVLAAASRNLEVAAIPNSRFISIRFTSVDSELAARFANALAEHYRARLASSPVEETRSAVNALTPKLEALRKEVFDAEARVESFRASTGLLKGNVSTASISDQRTQALADQLAKA